MPRLSRLGSWLAIALCVATPVRAENQTASDRLDVVTYLEWEGVADPQLSPDGSQVLYVRRWVDKLHDEWKTSLWLMNADGSRDRFLVEGKEARWSPDGSRIAYLAKGEPAETQMFVRWMDSGATSQITRLTQKPAGVHWSPDGNRIAFTMRVPSEDKWKIDMPKPPEGGKWTEAPRHVQNMHYRADRRGFLEEGYMHLFVVPADGGTPRQITAGEWNVGARTEGIPESNVGLCWTPDGRSIVFDALRDKDADVRYRESHIWAVDIASREIRQITHSKGPWVNPSVAPNGRLIAFVGYEWTPQTYKSDELWVVNLDGSDQRRISGDFDRDPEQVQWARDSKGLWFTAADRGSRNVQYAPLSGGVRQVTKGTHVLNLTSVTGNGFAVGTRSASQTPEDVVAFRLGAPAKIDQLTHVNEDVLEGRTLGTVEEIWYDSSGGARIQGWVVKPPGFQEGRKYPLILQIHGGPHAMYNVGFNYSFQNFAANDFVVLYTNPRGSTGYGTAFGNAIDDAYPSVDYDDLMAGVDVVLAKGYVDPNRLYVTGQSGGGVLSSWIVGHTTRFAATAVRAPVTNWISFAGNTDLTAWGFYRFRTPYWKDPTKWLERSPIMYVENVKTPVLLMTGVLDLRTPMGQTEEYFQALKTLGVPVEMLRFNEEYHGTSSKPSNFMRTQLYIMSWFNKYPPTTGTETTSR